MLPLGSRQETPLPGQHRRRTRAQALFRSAIAALVAIAVVAGVIAAFNVGNGHKSHSTDPAAILAVSTSPAPSLSDSATRSAPVSIAPTSSAPPTRLATTAPPKPAAPGAPAPGSRGAVTVYNGSGAPVATARAVATLQAAGYAIARTRTVRYRVTQTTVFYDSGTASAAQVLVALHIGVLVALPRPRTVARTGTLIVVVAPGYAP